MKKILAYIFLIVATFLLSYMLTAGIVWTLCWIVGVDFSFRLATGVWLAMLLLKGFTS